MRLEHLLSGADRKVSSVIIKEHVCFLLVVLHAVLYLRYDRRTVMKLRTAFKGLNRVL